MLLNVPPIQQGFTVEVHLLREGKVAEKLVGAFARVPVVGDLLPIRSPLAVTPEASSFARVVEVVLNGLAGMPNGAPVALVKAAWD